MRKMMKHEISEFEDDIEIEENELEEQPVINIVFPNNIGNDKGENAPIFIRKLKTMVNDENNKDIIGWNEKGDGIIIHDQVRFVTQTLLKYFKHNNLASFVRQLNLYDFHKTQNIDKNEFQFSHPFFLKAVPQLMNLIKRKSATRSKPAKPVHKFGSEFEQIMKVVCEIKNKNDSISDELIKIRQENAALWGEVNNLRVKYSKQSKIVNKLIHFLITYIQKHHQTRKPGRTEDDTEDSIKAGPKIMELDYRYKNNPHEFWTDFDKEIADQPAEQQVYTVVEPTEENAESNQQQNTHLDSPMPTNIEEFLLINDQNLRQIDYDSNQPSTSSSNANDNNYSALQRAASSKENVSYVPDNSQFDFNSTIKELLKNLPPDEWATFCKLYNENNALNQDEEISENELKSLSDDAILPSLNDVEFRDEAMDIGCTDDDLLFDSSVDQYLNME